MALRNIPFPRDVPTSAIEDTSSRDREWFKKNPTRRYHVRPLYPEEWTYLRTADHPTSCVIVGQVTPGIRIRHTMCGGPMPSDRDEILAPIVAATKFGKLFARADELAKAGRP